MESIEQKAMRHKMETENKQGNRASWSDQQQAAARTIIPTKDTWFSRLGPSADILGESLFQADLFSIL